MAVSSSHYCSKACAVAAPSLEVRFWGKVQKGDGCWSWLGSRTTFGYGQIAGGDQRPRFAHRVAWELANGPIPPDMSVCHHCDNPPCVRPDHLFLGTQRENMHDAAVKGRVSGHKGTSVNAGEAHGNARLTDAAVREIKAALRAGRLQRELAEEYGVHFTAISRIARGVGWKHVA